jgi:hypothetical protein
MTASNAPGPEANGHDKPRPAPMPITVTHPEKVEVAGLRLFREPAWVLRLTIEGDRSYLKVKVVRAAPLSHPDRYVSFLDGKDEEICMVDDLKELDAQTRGMVAEELDRRYLTAVVESIHSMRNEFGTSYWDVATSRGRREFVVQNVAENAQWLGPRRLLLVDVDGNRFEFPDLDLLDKRSLGFVDEVL